VMRRLVEETQAWAQILRVPFEPQGAQVVSI